jgi:hypothetical protein
MKACEVFMKVPTDLKILEFIYKTYYKEFKDFSRENKTRVTKIFIPIDISKIALHFKTDDDIIFGRLYYHLNNRYGYYNDGKTVKFFQEVQGENKRCIHFPLLASALASLQEDHRRYRNTIIVTIWAILATVAATILAAYL